MYYENKRSFYIRQYGPPVLAIVISLLLIVGGLYIATISLENDLNKEQIASLTNDSSVDISNTMPESLAKLNAFTKSKEYKVHAISKDGGIVIETTKNEYYKINLIGIKNSTSLKEKMEEDLVNKKITIEFDNSKLEKNNSYAYVYINDTLYNKELLKKGYATLRVERNNVDKLDILLQAETEARDAKLGVWEA